MKKELSQMAFDFPMEAEPQAPPKNGLSAHHGDKGTALVLSAEEEHTVREEGRRAGVVVRIKSLKRSPEQTIGPVTETLVAPILAPVPQPETKTPERVFIQASIPLEEIHLPVVKAEIPVPVEETPESALTEDLTEEITVEPVPEVAPIEEAPIEATVPEIVQISLEEAIPEVIQVSAEELSPEVEQVSMEEPAPIEEAVPEIEQVSLEEPAPLEDLAPAAASPLVQEAPPFPPRKKSTPRPAAAEKTKPAPAEKTKSKRGRKSLKEVAAEADLINIPADEVLFSKQYYTMGEVAEMFRVNQSLLRFWETEFSILQPRKNRKGDRYFRPVDIKNLHLIYHLLRQRKYTIEGAKEFLRKNKKAEQRFEAIQRLQQIKAFLLELKAQL